MRLQAPSYASLQTNQGRPSSGPEQSHRGDQEASAAHSSSDASEQQKGGGRRRFKEVKDAPPSVQFHPAQASGGLPWNVCITIC